jgi:hypothetical protein
MINCIITREISSRNREKYVQEKCEENLIDIVADERMMLKMDLTDIIHAFSWLDRSVLFNGRLLRTS